mmetsp:Transcript_11865/g.18011  ORF Transcript_11865/g.18011 Transcript_11865/m.18011 type:complete len:257 (+) Transcript_11865:1085-1855(+)
MGRQHSVINSAGCMEQGVGRGSTTGGAPSNNPRCSFKAATVVIGIPCSRPKRATSLRRDMVPSSFVSSEMQATGGSIPASLHRATDASVCPERSFSSPFLAMRGKIWPGRDNSSGFVPGCARRRKVSALSLAEIPVEPRRASQERVKAVRCLSVLLASTINGKPSSCALSSIIGAQMIPDEWRIINAMCDSPQKRAAITRSPSFSRDASSITSTILPSAIALMTVGMGDKNWIFGSLPIRAWEDSKARCLVAGAGS